MTPGEWGALRHDRKRTLERAHMQRWVRERERAKERQQELENLTDEF